MKTWTNSFIVSPALSMLLALPAVCSAHEAEETGNPDPPGKRTPGSISFPTPTRVPAAREALIEGALLPHLFEYPLAREQFLLAEQPDPDLVMACGGEACMRATELLAANFPEDHEIQLPGGNSANDE